MSPQSMALWKIRKQENCFIYRELVLPTSFPESGLRAPRYVYWSVPQCVLKIAQCHCAFCKIIETILYSGVKTIQLYKRKWKWKLKLLAIDGYVLSAGFYIITEGNLSFISVGFHLDSDWIIENGLHVQLDWYVSNHLFQNQIVQKIQRQLWHTSGPLSPVFERSVKS